MEDWGVSRGSVPEEYISTEAELGWARGEPKDGEKGGLI